MDDKDDQKERLLKRLRNIKDKNEEQLQLFSKANKISRIAKKKSEYNYNNKLLSKSFTKTLKTLEKGHWGLNTAT